MNTLFDKISEDIKAAMLARDKVKLEALRGAKKEFLEAVTAKGGSHELEDEKALQILSKMIKQREESASIYREQDRPDLAEAEEKQAEALREYMPAQMSQEEIESLVRETISSLGVTDMKGMGRVMGEVSKQTAGRADGKVVADIVKNLLSNK